MRLGHPSARWTDHLNEAGADGDVTGEVPIAAKIPLMNKSNARPLLRSLAIACAFALALPRLRAEPRYDANWASLDNRACPAWYQDAKFGIFIHWGVYSVPAWGVKGEYAEWYWKRISDKKPDNPWWQFHKANYGESFPYQDFAPKFRAELFDPAQWADIFARSGAKYIVPTSKHHEGFALWPSMEASRDWGRPWNSVEIGPKRDLIGELSDAVRARGLKFGFYYSLYEWFNPLWLSDRQRFVDEHLFPQFKDVVTRYKPSIIFSDGEWEMTSKQWKSEELLAWLFNESPSRDEVVVDDRWGSDTRHKHGGYYTTEYAAGMEGDAHPWEESQGMGFSYGYNRAENLDDYKSARNLVLLLADTVSRGGNLLLDIGPGADGTIPVIMQQRLIEMGDWLKVNGEAIYGTRFAGRSCQWTDGPRPSQQFGEYKVKYDLMNIVGQEPVDGHAVKQLLFTRKSDALYAISIGWPTKTLVIRDVQVPASSQVTLLGYSGKVDARVSGTSLTVDMPDVPPDGMPCRYAYTLRIPGAVLLPEAQSAVPSR
jgi:alpha-L-fucosidase